MCLSVMHLQDTVSEAAVQQAVQRLVRGRTVLVIAHRLSTVQVRTEEHLLTRARRFYKAGYEHACASTQIRTLAICCRTTKSSGLLGLFAWCVTVSVDVCASVRVQAADQIVVMADGRAAEVGTHAELSARPTSVYSKLMNSDELILASV